MPRFINVAISESRKASEKAIADLFDWAVSVVPKDIPDDAKSRAVQVLFDDIAAMVAAASEPEFQRVLPRLGGENGHAESTVFCAGLKTDRRSAALVNAVSANWLELDEGYRVTPCHAGLYLLPALLAEAEASGSHFEDVLHALVVGYEVITRIARAFSQQPVVMQSHGRFAAVGAAIAVSLSRKLPAQLALAATSAAVTLVTPAPRNHLALGALVRNMWAGVGAQSGMATVEWADAGISGAPGSFYDVYCTVLGGGFEKAKLIDGLGSSWAITEGFTKVFACCQHLHAGIEAVLEIRDAILKKGLAQVVSINVETHDLALPLNNAQPHNTLAAKFSMSHALAAALVTGEGGAPAFCSDMVTDESINRLRSRVSMAPWPLPMPASPNDRPTRVEVQFTDGTRLEATCLSAKGGPDRPYATETRLAKIGELTANRYPRLKQIVEALVGLPAVRMHQPWRDIVKEFTSP
jgi:2-methylcitrate dehydratase PrpD